MALKADILARKREVLAAYQEFARHNRIQLSALQGVQQRRAFFIQLEAIEPRLDSALYESLVELLVTNEIYLSLLTGELE